MDEGEKEEEPRAAMNAMIGKRREQQSVAAIVESVPESLSEAPLLLEPGCPGESNGCNSWGFKAVIEKLEEEEFSEFSFEAMAQPESVIESEPLPSLPANDSISNGLKKSPKTIDENSSGIWHTLSTWWKKDKRKKHTINWADIEIDVCPPPDSVEEPWQLSPSEFIEKPWQETPPEHYEPELEALPSPINGYSSSGWLALPTWWKKEKREKSSLIRADIDACPPPGSTEESGMIWTPEHESDLSTTKRSTVLSKPKSVVDLAELVNKDLGD